MFWFDKDMERVMLAKKKEVLEQIEDAKKRVLKELYCVKSEVHTDFCEMLADYNRIDFALKKLVADLKQEVKDCVDSYKNILAEQIVSFNQQIDTKINVFEQYVIESIATLENALAELETMQTTVNNAIVRLNELLNNSVTSEELEQLATELRTEIANAGVQSDWNESDENSKSFVKNRTHYRTGESITEEINANYDLTGKYTIKFNIGDNKRPAEIKGVIDNKPFSLPYVGKINAFVYEQIESTWKVAPGVVDVYGDYKIESATLYANTICAWVINGCAYVKISVNYHSRYFNVAMSGSATLSITSISNESVKTIEPDFLGGEPKPNSFLRTTGSACEWCEDIFAPMVVAEILTVFDGVASFVSKGTKDITFKLGNLGATPFKAASIGHTVNVGQLQYRYSSQSGKDYGSSDDVRFWVNNEGITTFSVALDLESNLGDYEANGVPVSIYRQDSVRYETLINLYSPNGTKYRLSVSDDGTLSATPVTT